MSVIESRRVRTAWAVEIERQMAESIVAEPLPASPVRPEIDPRVLRGVLHLDEHHPGWAKRIDLDTFRLRSAENCVVGQLFGHYNSGDHFERAFGFDKTTNPPARQEALGVVVFDFEHGEHADRRNPSDVRETWDLLERDWRIMIAERQS